MINTIKILRHQGKQFIPDLRKVKAPGIFRGRPDIGPEECDEKALAEICPTGAIMISPVGSILVNVPSVESVPGYFPKR